MDKPTDSRPTYVIAFDRDETISVNPPKEKKPVPLSWVKTLAQSPECEVYATGNQLLKEEAGIPGIEELVEAHPTAEIRPIEDDAQISGYHPTRRERLEILADLYPDAERIVVDDEDLSDVDGWDHYHSWDFVQAIATDELTLTGDLDKS